ncbi:hypothetical protein [Prochlorococcus sp. MIT 1223]|uniref:hypothetical protein n=1 Tax=Prochlorococcus sp. MIT 1223 TaxID=3096217 RepID=UPI002A75E939|nr:hypothetical protein [Prochlorococcus sp. MIT 1223]
MNLTFALNMNEMGLNPFIISLIVGSSLLFIIGFTKSSQENEYKKLMDSFINSEEEDED